MSVLDQVIPEARALPRADKARLIQILVNDLAGEEQLIPPDQAYPIWSPDAAFEAADVMLRVVRDEAQP